jgi:hypothetical protein
MEKEIQYNNNIVHKKKMLLATEYVKSNISAILNTLWMTDNNIEMGLLVWSYARNQALPYSDVDFEIVLKNTEYEWEYWDVLEIQNKDNIDYIMVFLYLINNNNLFELINQKESASWYYNCIKDWILILWEDKRNEYIGICENTLFWDNYIKFESDIMLHFRKILEYTWKLNNAVLLKSDLYIIYAIEKIIDNIIYLYCLYNDFLFKWEKDYYDIIINNGTWDFTNLLKKIKIYSYDNIISRVNDVNLLTKIILELVMNSKNTPSNIIRFMNSKNVKNYISQLWI